MKKNILFFDGVCGLCNNLVNFLLKVDKKEIIYFSPLQGKYAHQNLPSNLLGDFDTVIVQTDKENILIRSEAIFYLLELLPMPWKILGFMNFMPIKFYDFFYKIISTYRYQIFEKKPSCRLPTASEKSRFL